MHAASQKEMYVKHTSVLKVYEICIISFAIWNWVRVLVFYFLESIEFVVDKYVLYITEFDELE